MHSRKKKKRKTTSHQFRSFQKVDRVKKGEKLFRNMSSKKSNSI